MKRMPWSCRCSLLLSWRSSAAWLLGVFLLLGPACVLDAHLGSHQGPSQAARPDEAQQRDPEPSADSAPSESAAAIVVPHAGAATPDDSPAADAPHEPMPADQAHDASVGDTPPHEVTPTGDHPAAEDAATAQPDPPHDPPATEPDPMPVCDTPTDNLCLSCEQSSCCAPRRACLEVEACACRLQCRTAEHPADCAAACPAAPDRYEPWLQCLHDHCADACVL